jgi:anti-sigma factor RsiW
MESALETEAEMNRKRQASQSLPCSNPGIGERFPLYLHGELNHEEASLIRAHLKACSECRREMNLWVSLVEDGVPKSRTHSALK